MKDIHVAPRRHEEFTTKFSPEARKLMETFPGRSDDFERQKMELYKESIAQAMMNPHLPSEMIDDPLTNVLNKIVRALKDEFRGPSGLLEFLDDDNIIPYDPDGTGDITIPNISDGTGDYIMNHDTVTTGGISASGMFGTAGSK